MADIFISFRTGDADRVQPIYDGLVARGLTVFWSNAIPTGAPNYQAIIEEELREAGVVLVLWTHASVQSEPVLQECLQALRYGKLIQAILDDDIPPIRFPMEIPFKAQKAILVDWVGDIEHREWRKLNESIDARIEFRRSPEYKTSLEYGQILLDRLRERSRKSEARRKVQREREAQAAKAHMKPGNRVTARDPGFGPITVHVQTDVGEVWLSVDRALSDELDKRKRIADYHKQWPVKWTVPAERGPAPYVTLILSPNDAAMLTFPRPKA